MKAILLEQEMCCKSLVGLLQRERTHLIDFNVPAVEELAKEKDTILLRLRLLEEERQRLAAALAAEWPEAREGEITLRVIVERTGDAELSGIRLKLVSLAQSIEDLNSFNRHLIDRSLNSVRTATGFFNAFGSRRPETAGSGTLLSREM
ncbi:MAG: flagellar export chaperone FlgN [Deltaproteobacteria bacterium]|nr:flagellar export chaperone FlgN [Deltaproteobacteria bacterium]